MRLLLTSIAFFLAATTAIGGSGTASEENPSVLVWPAPPAQPRVSFVRQISRQKDLQIRGTILGRLKDILVGRREATFVRPMDVAIGRDGKMCIADVGSPGIYIYDPKAKSLEFVDRIDRDTALVSPVGVAVAGDGTMVVADSRLGKIFAINERGKFLFMLGEGEGLQRPTDVFVRDAKIYAVDAVTCQVFVFDARGKLIMRFGEKGKQDGAFNSPTHLYVDRQHRIYVTDALNFRVQIFDEDGVFLKSIGSAGDSSGHFSRPKGVAVDSYGHIYVVDALFDNVQIFDLDRNFLLDFGKAGHGDGEFWLPSGIAIDENNYIYVTDSYNQRISVYRYVGAQ